MRLPRLDEGTVRTYLARLGGLEVSIDHAGLERLLRAHLRALPFHNLSMLAGGAGPPGRSWAEAAIEGNLAGWGGAHHQLTVPLLALLESLGFEVWPAAASMHVTGDHVVGIVRLPSGRFLVDAGSGHPCLHPLPLDGEPLDFAAYGWRYRFERSAHEEYRLLHVLPDGQSRTAYRLTPEPCSEDFLEALAHRRLVQEGDRSALASVHSVRMGEWVLATFQDGVYQRFVSGLSSSRPVEDWEAMVALLRLTFGLPDDLLEACLSACWARTLRSSIAPRHRRPRSRFILSLAAMGRSESVARLLDSVIGLLERTGRPAESIGVLVLDNGPSRTGPDMLEAVLDGARKSGFQTACVNARDASWRLEPFQQRGLLPSSLSIPLPIGASRTLQTRLLWEHLCTGSLGLPHPGDGGGPVLVWMLDDDLSFQRLREAPTGLEAGPGDDLFTAAEALWAGHPQVSVVLGSFTGDPPIPGYATFQVQVHDLVENLRGMAALPPDTFWAPGRAFRSLPDYYYDHARGSTAHLQVHFPWWPTGAPPWTARDAFKSLCAAFAQVPRGRQVTRPLTHRAAGALMPGRNRGGNALFLDLDALVVAPYPVLGGEDGIQTRRADTLWAHLAARQPLFHMVQADLDLLHGRRVGDGSSPLAEPRPDAAALRRFVESQERGVVLARLLEQDGPLDDACAEREISIRRGLLMRSREALRLELAEARRVLSHPEAWWWSEEAGRESARSCLASLGEVESLVGAVDALDDPRLPGLLAAFARHVAASLPAWREVWG